MQEQTLLSTAADASTVESIFDTLFKPILSWNLPIVIVCDFDGRAAENIKRGFRQNLRCSEGSSKHGAMADG